MADDALPFGVGGPAENAVGAPQFVINALNAMGNAAAVPGRAYQSTEPLTSDQMVKPATDLASMVTLGAGAMPAEADALRMGIKAYHSSPHDFDRFDVSRIGVGQGAQSYGHGLYFSENPAVSGQGGHYWESFMPRFGSNEQAAADLLKQHGFDREKAMAASKQDIDRLKQEAALNDNPDDVPWYRNLLREREAQHGLLTTGNPVGPRTYEVDINADPSHLLDWHKPQGPDFAGKLKQVVPTRTSLYAPAGNPKASGREVHEALANALGEPGAAGVLQKAGIPGISYLDAGSRAAGEGSRNYVMFNDNLIKILKKYGIAGMPAGAAALSGGPQNMIDALKGQGNAGQ
jgi:hypothetical protein